MQDPVEIGMTFRLLAGKHAQDSLWPSTTHAWAHVALMHHVWQPYDRTSGEAKSPHRLFLHCTPCLTPHGGKRFTRHNPQRVTGWKIELPTLSCHGVSFKRSKAHLENCLVRAWDLASRHMVSCTFLSHCDIIPSAPAENCSPSLPAT